MGRRRALPVALDHALELQLHGWTVVARLGSAFIVPCRRGIREFCRLRFSFSVVGARRSSAAISNPDPDGISRIGSAEKVADGPALFAAGGGAGGAPTPCVTSCIGEATCARPKPAAR